MIKMRALKKEELLPIVPNLQGYLPIEGVGHWPQLEASDVVNDTLVAFLNTTRDAV
jgi:pimeloyl-ACP methyl ester carboxylesterase